MVFLTGTFCESRDSDSQGAQTAERSALAMEIAACPSAPAAEPVPAPAAEPAPASAAELPAPVVLQDGSLLYDLTAENEGPPTRSKKRASNRPEDYTVKPRHRDPDRVQKLQAWRALGFKRNATASGCRPSTSYVILRHSTPKPPADLAQRQASTVDHDDFSLRDGRFDVCAYFVWGGALEEAMNDNLEDELMSWFNHAAYPWVDPKHAPTKQLADRVWSIAHQYGFACALEDVAILYEGPYEILRLIDV